MAAYLNGRPELYSAVVTEYTLNVISRILLVNRINLGKNHNLRALHLDNRISYKALILPSIAYYSSEVLVKNLLVFNKGNRG